MAGPMRYNLKGMPSFKKALSKEINGLEIKSETRTKGPFDSITCKPSRAEDREDYIKKRRPTFKSIVSGDTEISYDSDESHDLEDSDEFEDSGYMSDKENQDPHIKGSKPTLPTLPIQVIKELFLTINDPGFAISLALTCKRFYIIHFRKNGPMLPSKLFWWGTYAFVYLRDWMGPEYEYDYMTARFARKEEVEAADDATAEDEITEGEAVGDDKTEDEIIVDNEYYLHFKSESLFEKNNVEVFEDATTNDETSEDENEDETEDGDMLDEAIEEEIAGLKKLYGYASDSSTTEDGEVEE